ncbi:MAG TPA: hypothetical protein VM869_23315, partial [Enhygromyxa sp.]|nr:hypothetical protein [Enhygromyxa sp.]
MIYRCMMSPTHTIALLLIGASACTPQGPSNNGDATTQFAEATPPTAPAPAHAPAPVPAPQPEPPPALLPADTPPVPG